MSVSDSDLGHACRMGLREGPAKTGSPGVTEDETAAKEVQNRPGLLPDGRVVVIGTPGAITYNLAVHVEATAGFLPGEDASEPTGRWGG